MFSPAAVDSQEAEGNRTSVAALSASLAGARSMVKVVIPGFDQVFTSRVYHDPLQRWFMGSDSYRPVAICTAGCPDKQFYAHRDMLVTGTQGKQRAGSS